MNQEPIAWMQTHYQTGKPTRFSQVKTWEDDVPLYTAPIPDGYVILCKKCGEDLGFMFDEHPKVTSHEELTAITKEWVYVQRI